jgi:hypothetical protein
MAILAAKTYLTKLGSPSIALLGTPTPYTGLTTTFLILLLYLEKYGTRNVIKKVPIIW